ncbi:hypothetical protein CLV84_3259 [Neolewinella xylanilytica]|uniref:Outer membrane protein with beta-barrel domain n=1 Tax=Neolewinella xylanilytica TaxID=1514080 RepID=A0A2S6I577_9BACT|nr:hypothetical protein [Neolewinella xylanilytica]PPK86333.1 hypothetical protein CLV84_3259 [Neolewinella xylanilytica]
MRYLFLLFGCLLLGSVVSAQVGITGFYNLNEARMVGENADPVNNELDYANGPEIALNYWFRLPKNRIEFQPTVYYARSGERYGWNEAGFQFKTNIYLFDLGTDCDCPTFGKQGPQLEKGFFLQLSPGVSRHWLSTAAENLSGKTAFTLGAGIGIDFGISNLITLTPIAALRYTATDFTDMIFLNRDGLEVSGIRGALTAYQLGIQATFRFDKKRY